LHCTHESLYACDALHEPRLNDEQYFDRHGAGVPDGDRGDLFAALVAPLEELAGRPIVGVNRARCFRAFAQRPQAFGRLVEDAIARGNRNPVGLLCRMVLMGDHLTYVDAS
jgi:hypothetical protein